MAEVKVEKSITAKSRKKIQRDYLYAVGRRREAVARVRLYSSIKESIKWGDHGVVDNQILVNALPVEKYFSGELSKAVYMAPILAAKKDGHYAFTVKVEGGGKHAQLEAMVHGISRVLAEVDKGAHRTVLKSKGFLTRDARVRERRKVGTGGKARRKKQSPKR